MMKEGFMYVFTHFATENARDNKSTISKKAIIPKVPEIM